MENLNDRLDDIEKLILDLKNQKCSDNLPPVPQGPKLVKIEEAAKICGYKKGYVYTLVFRNTIPYIKRGRRVLFDTEELENWIKAGRPSIISEAIKSLKR